MYILIYTPMSNNIILDIGSHPNNVPEYSIEQG